MHNQSTHTFIDDTQLVEKQDIYSMVQTVKRESTVPLLEEYDAGFPTPIGYACCVYDPMDHVYIIWYTTHAQGRILAAVSRSGENFEKKGFVGDPRLDAHIDNLHVLQPVIHTHPWFENARWIGTAYCSAGTYDGRPIQSGIYVMKSSDGLHWQMNPQPVLPGVGDRSALGYDPHRGIFLFSSRPPYSVQQGRQRFFPKKPGKIALWESADLMSFEYKGVVLQADRYPGYIVTMPVEAAQPMRLTLNASCPTGYVEAEILDMNGEPVRGYYARQSRRMHVDEVCCEIAWEDRRVVCMEKPQCMIKIQLCQGSLFSWTWSPYT